MKLSPSPRLVGPLLAFDRNPNPTVILVHKYYNKSTNLVKIVCITHVLYYSTRDYHISFLLKTQYILPHVDARPQPAKRKRPPLPCLHLITRRGDSSHACGACWRPFLMYMHVVRAELQVLSLSLSIEEDRSTFVVMARIWAKF